MDKYFRNTWTSAATTAAAAEGSQLDVIPEYRQAALQASNCESTSCGSLDLDQWLESKILEQVLNSDSSMLSSAGEKS